MSKTQQKKVKAWVLLIDDVLDVMYDVYPTKRIAKEYATEYRKNGRRKILPCSITYSLPLTKKSK